ncbi:MAG: ATP-binding protein [Rhodopirellula sp. JB055]|uniref:PAS domain-containing sensor histidine kinase n=1 Tax=Rhodopirellula sp. JB055 TaxID=3342846 RepID=UPI00370B9AE7
MSDPTNADSVQQSKCADDAQRRVRWLSTTGVSSGILFFVITTALLNWHQDSRTKASAIEARINEARLAMSRATVSRNEAWTQLLTESFIPDQRQANTQSNSWHEELVLVQQTCEVLNAALQLKGSEKLSIEINPLEEWSIQAERWKERHTYLTTTVQQQFSSLDDVLEELLRESDKQRGIHRLRLALGLRSQLSNQPKPIKQILKDCAGSNRSYEQSGNLKQLRLYLSQLMTTTNTDLLTDIAENQIRPILLRLQSSSDQLVPPQTLEKIESGIFDPITDHFETAMVSENSSKESPGILPLQLAISESRLERKRLVQRAAEHGQVLDQQRSKLAMAGDVLKNQYTESFANTLRMVWYVKLALGIMLGLVFLFLTRKVSQAIAFQVDAIDRTANELANEQLLLESVLSNLPIPLYWIDENGRYQGCSQSFANWIGIHSAKDIIGKTDEDLPWDVATSEHKATLDRSIMRYGIPITNQEVQQRRNDGKSFVVLASKTPLFNHENSSVGLVGTYIDITERKAAEERMNGLAKIQAECPSEIYVFSMHSLELLELNQAAWQNLRVDEQEYRGKPISNFLSDADTQKLMEHLQPIIDGNAVEVEYELTHVRSDRTTYPVHVRTLTIEHESEQVFVTCATDMTLHQKLENKLLQAQKLESIGQLAAGIAHEINTPMQCIGGNIDFLQEYTGRLLAIVDTFQELLQTKPESWEARLLAVTEMLKANRFDFIRSQFPMAIEETSTAANRVVEIVRAMRVMSHPGAQTKRCTDINELVHDAKILSRNRWKCVASVELSLDENLPAIDALSAELSQVFLNLIVNAADAIAEQQTSDSAELGEINVLTKFDDDSVYIEVRDNGPGMSDEVKTKAFEPFFTTKEVGKGTGQGLSITYDVVTKLHNGTVEIQSTVGEGTSFMLCLPRDASTPATSPPGVAVIPTDMPNSTAPAGIL